MIYALIWLGWLALAGLIAWLISRPIVHELRGIREAFEYHNSRDFVCFIRAQPKGKR